MRLSKSVVAVAVGVVLLSLAQPAPAIADLAASRISVSAPTAVITGAPFTVRGQGSYLFGGTWVGLNRQRVTLDVGPTPTGPWRWVTYLETSSTGAFQTTTHLTTSSYYKAIYQGTALVARSESAPVLVTVKPRLASSVTLSGPSRVLSGVAFTLSGKGTYSSGGTSLPLNRQRLTLDAASSASGPWRWVSYLSTTSTGTYSTRVALSRSTYFKVVYLGTTYVAPSASSVKLVSVVLPSGCVTSSHSGTCGPYNYGLITNSNGYNTYVGNNMWACGPNTDTTSCGPQTLTAYSPGNWKVVSRQTAGNTAVRTYPNVQQLMSDWNGGGWNGGGAQGDTPVSKLSALTSTYAETMPRGGGTIAQAAWDIWLSGTSGANEVMVWVDNVGRGSGGATQRATATIGGQTWTLYSYGSGELIWSLGAPGHFAQQSSGTVDLLALLRWLVTHGYESPSSAIGQIDFGWEICSTGGTSSTFAVSDYRIHAAA